MNQRDIEITTASPMEAIERVLQDATVSERPYHVQQESFLLGYNVEAANLGYLINNAIEEIRTLASEQAALILACEVSGFHATDDGHRLWGTIECVTTGSRGGESTRVDDANLVRMSPTAWRLTARYYAKEPT